MIGATVDGEWLAVHVDDEGIGIPADGSAAGRRSRSTGPGMSASRGSRERASASIICRRLVEAHGGSLTLGDRPDGRPGTRVSFTLPILAGGRQIAGSASVAAARRSARWLSGSSSSRTSRSSPRSSSCGSAGPATKRGRPDRQRRAAPVLRNTSGSRDPRRLAAGPRWLAGHRADPGVQPGPDHHGHRPQLRGRQDPRAQARRGRLHHQAAELPGARRRGSKRRCAGRRRRPRIGRAASSIAT